MRRPTNKVLLLWTVLAAILLASSALADFGQRTLSQQDSNTLLLPYMAVGGPSKGLHFVTAVSVENSHPIPNSGTIEFYTGDGRQMDVRLNSQPVSARVVDWTVPSRGSKVMILSAAGDGLETGWLRIRRNSNSSVNIVVLVQFYNGNQLVTQGGAVAGGRGSAFAAFRPIPTRNLFPVEKLQSPGRGLLSGMISNLNPQVLNTRENFSISQWAPPIRSFAQRFPIAARMAKALFIETGFASWYGEEFEGRSAADGSVFDPEMLTAAHPTLPFGTLAKVTNLRNGRSVVVEITDRGPFAAGRILDLSSAAAREIQMLDTGVSMVHVEAVPKL